MHTTLSAAQARRLALAAQGFAGPRPARVGTRTLTALVRRLHLLQIDSVNVFERSHYLPAFSRLGGYDRALLDRLAFARRGAFTEYWAHEASLLPATDLPLLRWRMRDFRERQLASPDSWASAHRGVLDRLRERVAAEGPLAASEIDDADTVRRGPWWGWSDVKRGLETLFRWGELASAGRTRFERRYALPEHVLGPDATGEVERAAALRELMARAARAHGVGTLGDLADYYRLPRAEAGRAARELEDAGTLVPVRVEGWERGGRPVAAWRHREAVLPRRLRADALLSPFDPVAWCRPRAERLFGFRYRIEIYTPRERRIHGYYVLPVLLGDTLAARVDLKSDRAAGILRVQAAWAEPDAPADAAERVAALLASAAGWQGFERVEVAGRGDLAARLDAALARTGAGL